MELGQRVRQGLAGVKIDGSLREAAARNVELWLTDARFASYRPGVERMVERGQWELLMDSFYRMMTFGTGGRRGAVGPGPNRINPYTVTTSVEGHCRFLRVRLSGQPLVVVLAADVRRFTDLRGLYDRERLGELYGLTSKRLCVMAAEVYAANGVQVVMADPAEETYVSTPELSFLIVRLGAAGGLNVSASHNHPDDNGTKFYNAAGGQEVPPYDEELVTIATGVEEARRMPFDDAVGAGLVRFITPAERRAYIELNLALSLEPSAREAKVAFSPLHGTGLTTANEVLRQAGFAVTLNREQATFDGAFPHAPLRNPNPEAPSAMQAVIETAKANGCDAAMATDPDADRLGVAVPDRSGRWTCLTGNQIGVLMAYHVLSARKRAGRLAPGSYVVKTEVTTELLSRLAASFGVRCIGHLLVGFKYIGDVLDQVARKGAWGDFEAREEDFLMAMEESHGMLASPRIRDKDAANGALLVAELASLCKRAGSTLYERLLAIYKEFGYFGTALRSVVMEGAQGLADIRRIQDSLRAEPPASIAGRKVLEFCDRQDEGGVFGKVKSETDRASRDVLVFRLEGDVRLTLRPSGTEPKSKSYAEHAGRPLGRDASDAAMQEEMERCNGMLAELLRGWESEMLARIGVALPGYATFLADALPLPRKLRFVEVTTEIRELMATALVVSLPQRSATGVLALHSTGPVQRAEVRVRDGVVERVCELLASVGPLPHLEGALARLAEEWGAKGAALMAVVAAIRAKG